MTQTAAVAPLKAGRTDIYKPFFTQLRIKDDFNIRKDYGNIEELADSIQENGVKVAMRGYKDKEGDQEVFVITDGHRRFLACQNLFKKGIEVTVPFILEQRGYNDEQRLIDMFITNEGKNLTPLEQAEGIRRLLAYGYTEIDIAKKLSKSEGYIRKLNSLNSAPKKFLNLIETGVISATLAISTIAEGKVDQLIAKVEETAKQGDQKVEDQQQNQDADGKDIREVGQVKSGGKVTKKDLDQVNSIKEFKKFSKNVDENLLGEDVLYIFQFASKLINNELTGKEIEDFFK